MNIRESQAETLEHIMTVRDYLTLIIVELLKRGTLHDESKLVSPEVELFAEHVEKLKTMTYGSQEYIDSMEALKPALDHHYKANRHHPQYFKDGISGMNLVDIIEMFCDWKAAGMRHKDGSLSKSIEINTQRFMLGSQLVNIFQNSVGLLE